MHPSAMLACAAFVVAVAASGCSGQSAGDAERAPAVTASASPMATASHTPTLRAADEPTAAADFYCDAADDGAVALGELLDATDRKSAETGVEGNGGDPAVMRSAGADMLTAMDAVIQSWTAAGERIGAEPWADDDAPVTNDQAQQAYAAFFEYLDVFARPEAHIAAQSPTIEQYSVATASLLAEPGTILVATEGAAALSDILGYNVSRCGTVPFP